MKKILSIILTSALALTSVAAFAGCSSDSSSNSDSSSSSSESSRVENVTIAVPNDTTNEARALLLLEELGYITLDKDAGITATVKDITDNPHNIKFNEVEAAQVPNVLQDVDYAVINSNYAIEASLNPVKDSLESRVLHRLTVTFLPLKRATKTQIRLRHSRLRSKASRLRILFQANMTVRLSVPLTIRQTALTAR